MTITSAVLVDGRPQVTGLAGRQLRDPAVDALIDQLAERVADEDAMLWLASGIWHNYYGSWQPGRSYAHGALALYAGNIWITLDETEERPGSGASWRLALDCLSMVKLAPPQAPAADSQPQEPAAPRRRRRAKHER